MNCSHCQSNPAQFQCSACETVYCSEACAHQDWISSHALICGPKRERDEEEEEEVEIQLTFMNEPEPRSFFIKPSRFWTIYELIQDAGLKSPIPIPNMDLKTFLTLLYREESRIKTADVLVRVFAAANYLDGDSDFNQLGQMVAERLKRDEPNPILTQLPRDLYRNYIFPNFDLAELKQLREKYPSLEKLVDEEISKRAKEMFPLLDNPLEAYEYLGGKTKEKTQTDVKGKYYLKDEDFQQIPNLGPRRYDRIIMYDEAVVLQYSIQKSGGTLKGLLERIRIEKETQPRKGGSRKINI